MAPILQVKEKLQRILLQGMSMEVPLSACLAHQLNVSDGDIVTHRFAHVIKSQRSQGRRHQRLHLHPCAACGVASRRDDDGMPALVKVESDGGVV